MDTFIRLRDGVGAFQAQGNGQHRAASGPPASMHGAAAAMTAQQRLLRAQAQNMALQAQMRNNGNNGLESGAYAVNGQQPNPVNAAHPSYQNYQQQPLQQQQYQYNQNRQQQFKQYQQPQQQQQSSSRSQSRAQSRQQQMSQQQQQQEHAPIPQETPRKKKKKKKNKGQNPLKTSAHAKEILLKVGREVAKSVTENRTVLNARSEMMNKKKQDEKDQRKRRKEAKELIQSLLRNKKAYKMPRWRHLEKGNRNPEPEELMRGISLFRMAARLVLYMIAKPWLSVRRAREESKAKQTATLHRTILMYCDATNEWLGKLVKVPLASLTRSPNVNLISSYEHSMMQTKVLCVTITDMLVDSGDPPEFLLDFFAILVLDGNYFTEGFMYDYEVDMLEYDQFGAVNNMQEKVNSDSSGGENVSVSAKTSVPSLDLSRATGSTKTADERMDAKALDQEEPVLRLKDKMVKIRRVRMLLLHYVLLNALIGQVLTSPWDTQLCAKPPVGAKEGQRALYNLRVLGTIFYMIARRIEPRIPPIQSNSGASASTAATKENAASTAPDVPEPAPFSLTAMWEAFVGGVTEGTGEYSGSAQVVAEKMVGKKEKTLALPVLHSLLLPETSFKGAQQKYMDTYLGELTEKIHKWILKIIIRSQERSVDDALISTRTGRKNHTARTARLALMREEVDDDLIEKIAAGALKTVRSNASAMATRRTGRVIDPAAGLGAPVATKPDTLNSGGGDADNSDSDSSASEAGPPASSRPSARFASGS